MSNLKIMFDLQDYLRGKPLGELTCDKVLCPHGDVLPALFVEQVDDVRVLHVEGRANTQAGVEIVLSSIEGLALGDRFTVVGRQSPSLLGASITMFSKEENDVEFVCHKPYNNMYSLSCLLAADTIRQSLYLSFVKTGSQFSGIDFCVDGVLIVRKER